MIGVLALLAAVLGGCRGAAQTDIVQREMREQEDKIYAMQDYLAQYQQLLCDSRRENARLRHQLGTQQSAAPRTRTAPGSQKGPTPWSPDRADGPSIGPPGTPSAPPQTTPAGPPDIEPAGPEVPPLGQTSQDELSPPAVDGDDASPADNHEPRLLVTSADEPIVVPQSLPEPGPPRQVWLDGEVLPGHDDVGGRLLIDVEPVDARGGPATLVHTMSLMVLDPDGPEGARSLARWDFAGDDLSEAAEPVSDGRAMRFRLQLPADATVDKPVELWVRLLDADGEKLLAHVDVDLNKVAYFASARRPALPQRQVAGETRDRALAESRTLSRRPGWSQWQIAQPGESNLLAERTGRAEGHWRIAAEPPPTVRLGLPVPEVTQAAAESDLPAEPTVVIPPSWSPTR